MEKGKLTCRKPELEDVELEKAIPVMAACTPPSPVECEVEAADCAYCEFDNIPTRVPNLIFR